MEEDKVHFEVGEWYLLVYEGLRKSIKGNLAELDNYQQRSVAAVAWASRNLLELMVWTDYCVGSPHLTHAFFQEAIADLFNMHATSDKNPVPEDALTKKFFDDQRSKLMDLRGKLGATGRPDKLKNVSDVADNLGLNPHYNREYKVLSKYTHPTAMSVILPMPKEVEDDLRCGFAENAFKYATVALAKIDKLFQNVKVVPRASD